MQLLEPRGWYNKVFTVILRTIFELNVPSIGKFFYNEFNVIELQKCFKERKISPSIVNNLIEFHQLLAVVYHEIEEGTKEKYNEIIDTEFKEKSLKEKENIIIAFPSLLNALNLSNAEKRKIYKSFKWTIKSYDSIDYALSLLS